MNTTPLTYWIVGAGRFGTLALRRLRKKSPAAEITVVDHHPVALASLRGLADEVICCDGAGFLVRHMASTRRAHWIVPAVPIHLAWEWMRRSLADQGGLQVVAVPVELERKLPNPTRGHSGQLFVSYADFVCPDNCREPYERCTFTGKPRKGLLYKLLEDLNAEGACSVVIRSRQLAPGIGGYRPEDLERGFEQFSQCKEQVVLLSTSCLCHGVIHAILRVADSKQPVSSA